MKVSAVAYLNSAPLYWGLKAGRHPADWTVSFDVPSACAARLRSGDAQVGLIPSIEFARDPALRLAAPLCVAARREVTSVLLACRGPLEALRRVHLDPTSRTSQALVRHLLSRVVDRPVSYTESAPDTEELEEGEAALVIGDRALALSDARPAGVEVVDLAALWHKETGLPFVFALWACREEACTEATRRTLEASYAYGVGHLEGIVSDFSPRLRIAPAVLRRYLTQNLHFTLGPAESEALALFFRGALHEEFPHERLRLPAPAA